MSFPSYLYNPVPYNGSLYSIPVGLATTKAQTNNQGTITIQGHQSKCVTTQFDWIATYPGNAVTVNLQSQGATMPLEKILMVYVDNTNNGFALAILFPDTQQLIGVPANSSGWYPVLTGAFFCTVYRLATAATDVLSQSTIIFCNFAIPQAEATEFQNSLSYDQISDNAAGRVYEIPAMGDKGAIATWDPTTASDVIVLATTTLPQIYVITDITLQCRRMLPSLNSGNQAISFQLVDGFSSTILRQIILEVHPDMTSELYTHHELLSGHGLYLTCRNLTLHGTISGLGILNSGQISCNVSYALISPTTPAL